MWSVVVDPAGQRQRRAVADGSLDWRPYYQWDPATRDRFAVILDAYLGGTPLPFAIDPKPLSSWTYVHGAFWAGLSDEMYGTRPVSSSRRSSHIRRHGISISLSLLRVS